MLKMKSCTGTLIQNGQNGCTRHAVHVALDKAALYLPNQGYLSEVGASIVDEKLGLNVVPKTKVSMFL